MLRLLRHLRARVRYRHFDADLQEELRVHEAMKREELDASGMPPGEARAAARRALGNVTLMREESRRVWCAPWLESVIQDARYGVRTLARQPVHSLTAIAVLVLAIGMNTSLFALLKATSFAPWPARDPDRVVRIWARAGAQFVGPSVDEYRFVREHATTLDGVAAYFLGGGSRLQAPGRVETYPRTQMVSANFLQVLGARLVLGAGFVAEDDLPGLRRAPAIISDHLWRHYFNADRDVVGQGVSVYGHPFTIVGVLDPAFDGLDHPVDLWLPLSAQPVTNLVTSVGLESPASASCCIQMVARLADRVDAKRAEQELQSLHDRFTKTAGRKTGTVALFGTAYADMPGARDRDAMNAVAAGLVLVLVLACANVGNLQLARGIARRREIATRVAIGAGRMRIVRQLLVEGSLLAAIAGGISVAAAVLVPPTVLRLMGPELSPTRAARFELDWQLIAVTVAICGIACLVFALAPALHATRRAIPLGSLDRGSTRYARLRLRSGFLATQIAVCTVLLLGAGLVTRAIVHAMTFDPGFKVQGVQRVSVSLPSEAPSEERTAFSRALVAEIERDDLAPIATGHPGPFVDFPFTLGVALPHEPPQDHRQVARRSVSRRYFDVLGIPLVSGRMFASDGTGEVVVNEAFVRTFWRGEDPVGRSVRHIDSKGAVAATLTIVGVVRDAYLSGLERIEPIVFRPTTSGVLITSGGPEALEQIRATATGLNAAASVRAWPLTDDVHAFLEWSRFGAAVAWGIGLLGLLLASVGVFGVFAYAVEERRREIGIRLALGAAGAQIVRTLVTTSGRAMLAGLGLGMLLSLACGPLLGSYLFGLSPVDPLAYAGVMLLLVTAGAVATFVPARRACSVDPAITLRAE
jgi:predicted permease